MLFSSLHHMINIDVLNLKKLTKLNTKSEYKFKMIDGYST